MATLSASRLIRALQGGEIIPYFQPQIELKTKSLWGFEVLARWQHPERGVLPPSEFIPLAEDANLLPEVTEAILGHATVALAALCPSNVRLSINVSAKQLLEPELCDRLCLIAECAEFPLSCLTLELTESSCIENVGLARAVAREVRSCGLRLSLDDFGKGYSCLRYLHEIPFDELKIDMSFVEWIAKYQRSENFVAGLISLGGALGINTVAEGIETEVQANLLTDLRCEFGQGFLFGAPIPTSAIPSLMMEIDAGESRPLCCVNAEEYSFEAPAPGPFNSALADRSKTALAYVPTPTMKYARLEHPIHNSAMKSQSPPVPFPSRRSLASPHPAQNEPRGAAGLSSSNIGMSGQRNEEDRLRELSHQLLQAQDEERRRIAREIHDSVLQVHALIALGLEKISSDALSYESKIALEDSKALITLCSEELRAICYLLHPPLMEDLGLESALRIYVEGLSRRTDIDIHLQVFTPLPRFDHGFELALFRVVQESLSNILRHSESSWAEVRIHFSESLLLEVEDRGKGLPAAFYTQSQHNPHMGVGIAGMQERIRQFGGTIELLPADPGLLVRAVFPKVVQV